MTNTVYWSWRTRLTRCIGQSVTGKCQRTCDPSGVESSRPKSLVNQLSIDSNGNSRGEHSPGRMFGDAGMPEAMADAVLGMSTGLRDGFVPEQERSIVTTTPTTLTTLRAWVRDELVG